MEKRRGEDVGDLIIKKDENRIKWRMGESGKKRKRESEETKVTKNESGEYYWNGRVKET